MNLPPNAPFLSFGFPMGAEWLCILGFLALVGVAVFLVVRFVAARPPVGPPSGFPVGPPVPPGPGQYRLSGVNRQTKADTVWECTADSPENARVKGELEGIVVTRVERV